MGWTPVAVLADCYGIEGATFARAPDGHTNETYLVDAPTGRFALRRAWTGKPITRIDREERVLAALATLRDAGAPLPTLPRLVPAVTGESRIAAGDRWVQLFVACDGTPGPRWLPGMPDAEHRVVSAMRRLAALHASLAAIRTAGPVTTTDPWHWLRERLDRVSALAPAGWPADHAGVLARIASLLDTVPVAGAPQWLHGDYHLGNLLWDGLELTGVVDFDDVGHGAATGEVALALFAFARRDVEASGGEPRLAYDPALWETGRAAYAAAAGRALAIAPTPALEQVFCAYQVLIHLEAASRGLWTLTPGIGFWPCWRSLT